MAKKTPEKWQFGDFQTPDVLAQKVVSILKRKHKIEPHTVIEPSCGTGAFVRSVLNEFEESNILGLDINSEYILWAQSSISKYANSENATIKESDFFDTDWEAIISAQPGYLLIVGNPPWVTSSELSILNSKNLPSKSNFQNRRGIEAITGSGNFDISEWMLLQYVKWLSKREGTIAVLCKYSVARKVMQQAKKRLGNRFSSYVYFIDAKSYFQASVKACLFILSTSDSNLDCEVYDSLDSRSPSYVIGERDGLILKDTNTYDRWKHLAGQDLRYLWRSGVKHDCSKVMVLERLGNSFFSNGLGEKYVLEEEYLFPLLKSSDVGNSRIDSYRKLVLITQKTVGEDTSLICQKAPKTWQYLLDHDKYLRSRKSSIYKSKPPYSVFGVGSYAFKQWKIAISGLYKRLNFCLVGPLDGKPVVFDDTVNFLSFNTEEEATFIFKLIASKPSVEFFSAMIFWDEKRLITVGLLRRLSLKAVAKELGCLEQYLHWADSIEVNHRGQFILGLSEQQAHYIA
ncbi:MAG: SAM-dependent methyltransferase [Phormidesmis sp.]